MDHEWSTSALGKNQVGWRWFALQLSDGRDIMFYQLMRDDGKISSFSSGTVVYADGSSRNLSLDDIDVDVTGHWQSPHSGVRYPSRWRMESLPNN